MWRDNKRRNPGRCRRGVNQTKGSRDIFSRGFALAQTTRWEEGGSKEGRKEGGKKGGKEEGLEWSASGRPAAPGGLDHPMRKMSQVRCVHACSSAGAQNCSSDDWTDVKVVLAKLHRTTALKRHQYIVRRKYKTAYVFTRGIGYGGKMSALSSQSCFQYSVQSRRSRLRPRSTLSDSLCGCGLVASKRDSSRVSMKPRIGKKTILDSKHDLSRTTGPLDTIQWKVRLYF